MAAKWALSNSTQFLHKRLMQEQSISTAELRSESSSCCNRLFSQSKHNMQPFQQSFLLQALRLFSFAALPCLIGCGPGLPTVEGNVTLDGEPIANAKVVFESPDRPMAVATTDEAGNYDVNTASERGMASGTYKVAISAYVTKDGGNESPIPILKTPKRYNSAKTSGLTVDVKAGKNQGVDFELTTKKK